MKEIWPHAIIHIDMDAFFASIEQMDFPELQGKPVVVTNGEQGTCIITSSYEARAFGIKTGMRIFEAKTRCPELIKRPSRPGRYAEISKAIMQALSDVTPDIEVFSVDEAFLDVTHCQRLYSSPVAAAEKAKQLVMQSSGGLTCSIGLSSNKTNAKFAAKLQKPNGFSVITPYETEASLKHRSVTDICGISHGIANFLKQYGVTQCGQMKKIPINVLAKRFGNLGRRLWYMCQGQDPDPVHITVPQPKSMGHGKVLPPNTAAKSVLQDYFYYLAERLAARLRQHNMSASLFFIGMKTVRWGWVGCKIKFTIDCDDGTFIFQQCKQFLNELQEYGVVRQIQITALDPKMSQQQLDLFCEVDHRQYYLNQIKDEINSKYGAWTITQGKLIERPEMPDVIAPAWRPKGPRSSIKD